MGKIYDCLIIGSGPCGIGAAIELKKMGADVAIIDRGMPGGKVNIAPRVDNYPGKKEIPGPELAMDFYRRLNEAEVEFIGDEVIKLTKENDLFNMAFETEILQSKTVLIATGTKERKIGLEKEDELLGHGISYCALCDGHFFKNKDIVVIGGGNAALKESIYLSNLANKLTLVHRRNEFRGSNQLVEELKSKANVTIMTPFVPEQILGEDKVTGIVIKHRETGELVTLPCDGLFPLVGQIPNTQFIAIESICDEHGTIPVNKNHETQCHGLFAGGDVLPRDIRQIYLAEHDGKVSAKSIFDYLNRGE